MIFIKKTHLLSLGVVSGLTLAVVSASNRLILTRNFFADSGHPLSALAGQDILLFAGLQKWVYALALILLLCKLLIVSLILYTALYLADHLVPFRIILHFVTLCEMVFLVAAVFKILWFSHSYSDGTLLEWHRFYFLSLLSLFPGVPADWYFPLQTLNAFEGSYWLLLAYGISKGTALSYGSALKVIMLSYVPALLVWIVVVTFCTIMFFPTYS